MRQLDVFGALTSGIFSLGGAIYVGVMEVTQDFPPLNGVFNPDSLFIPLSIVVALFISAIWFTARVVRVFDKWEKIVGDNSKKLQELENRIRELEDYDAVD